MQLKQKRFEPFVPWTCESVTVTVTLQHHHQQQQQQQELHRELLTLTPDSVLSAHYSFINFTKVLFGLGLGGSLSIFRFSTVFLTETDFGRAGTFCSI